MALAEAADQADVPDGMSVPEELARREERLQRIAAAKATIEARAKERLAREQAEHQAKLRAREDKMNKTGRKPGGRPPQPPTWETAGQSVLLAAAKKTAEISLPVAITVFPEEVYRAPYTKA